MTFDGERRDRSDYRGQPLDKLSPEALQQSLQRAAVFVVAKGLTKSEVVEKVRGFPHRAIELRIDRLGLKPIVCTIYGLSPLKPASGTQRS